MKIRNAPIGTVEVEVFSGEVYVEVVKHYLQDWFREYQKFLKWAAEETDEEKAIQYRAKADVISEMLVDLKTRGF